MPVCFLRRHKKDVTPDGRRGGEGWVDLGQGEKTNQNILYGKMSVSDKRKDSYYLVR